MSKLLNYASIAISVTYTIKQLLRSIKAFGLEKKNAFSFVKKLNCKLKNHSLQTYKETKKLTYVKQLQFSQNVYICKRNKCYQHINKNKFLTVFVKGHLLHVVRIEYRK